MEKKRTMVTLLPEWEEVFDRLKKERFYNASQAEMLRYVIGQGVAAIKKEKPKIVEPDGKEE